MARVQIVRKERRAGEPNAVTVDLSKGIEKTDVDSLPQLRPRDTIVVPSTAGEPTAAASGDSYQVLGSVRTPGAYRFGDSKTVVQALAACGGPLPKADLSSVHVTRSTPSGVVSYELDVAGHLERGKPIVDLQLKPGDTVLVAERQGFFTGFFEGVRTYAIPLLSVATSLLVIGSY
jgi:hypothetical protein